MELNARSIHEKRFHDAWRGYNQEEVDDFLDHLAEAIDRSTRENSALRERIGELDSEMRERREAEEMLKRTLMTAQQAAEEAIARARAKADEMISAADERVKKAEVESRDRSKEIEERIDQLRRFERETKMRLRTFFQQQLKALDALTDVKPPRFPDVRRPPRPSDPPHARGGVSEDAESFFRRG